MSISIVLKANAVEIISSSVDPTPSSVNALDLSLVSELGETDRYSRRWKTMRVITMLMRTIQRPSKRSNKRPRCVGRSKKAKKVASDKLRLVKRERQMVI